MTARTHDIFAFSALMTAAIYFPPTDLNILTLFAAIVGNIVGALIPDMDQAGNRLWDLLPAGDSVGRVFRRVFYKHRTISHSLLGFFIISKFLAWTLPHVLNPIHINSDIVLWSMMIGYASHLLADGLTEEGVPLLYPIKINFGFPPIKSWRIVTGGFAEKYVVMPLLALYILFIAKTYSTEFLMLINNLHF